MLSAWLTQAKKPEYLADQAIAMQINDGIPVLR